MIHRILPLARSSAVPVPGSREEQLRAGSGCPELTNKLWHGWRLLCPGQGAGCAEGSSPVGQTCVSLVLSARHGGIPAVSVCPRCHRQPGSGGDRSNTTAPGTARGARVVPPPPRTSSTLCMHLLFPGPPAPFLLSFVFLLRRELFDAACSLFSSVRVRTRLTHN